MLRDPQVWKSRDKHKTRGIANVLQISAVTHQMLPVFVRDKLPKELLDLPIINPDLDAPWQQAVPRHTLTPELLKHTRNQPITRA